MRSYFQRQKPFDYLSENPTDRSGYLGIDRPARNSFQPESISFGEWAWFHKRSTGKILNVERIIEPGHPVRGEVRHPANTGRPSVERLRLMLLHARVLFRTSLARLLATERDFDLVAECANAAEALESLRHINPGMLGPDVVLLDFSIWEDFIDEARKAGYQGKFLAIAEELDAAPCARALSRGVAGVFLVSDSPTRLVQAIRLVASGEAWVDRRMIQLLADRYPQHEDVRLDGLEERERAVLRGVLGGSTNRQIASQIGASEATVKATLQHLFDKTGVRSRSQLVRIMLDNSQH